MSAANIARKREDPGREVGWRMPVYAREPVDFLFWSTASVKPVIALFFPLHRGDGKQESAY